MAASFPGAVKTFSAVVNGVTKLVAALFNSPYDEITAIETALAQLIHTDGAIKAACINTTALKTTTGEVTTTSEENLTLPGGTYGFYPQLKGTTFNGTTPAALGKGFSDAGYLTNVFLPSTSGSIYAQQRYVTASGEDLWVFLKIDKATKEMISAYSAPDHPAYGNGGDFEKVSHPFSSYDATKNEIVLLDKETCDTLKLASQQTDKSILTLVNEEYKPNMSKAEDYQPLHSGQYLGKQKVMIETIPDYIKVRKLIALTNTEKAEKETIKQQRQQEYAAKKAEEDLIQAKIREQAISALKIEGKL